MAELYLPDASSWINALEVGRKSGMADRKQAASAEAGRLMTGGDYKGASATLMGAGELDGGVAVASYGLKQDEQTRVLTAQRTVQEKLAAGNLEGAYQAAAGHKDLLDGLEKITAHAKESTAILGGALESLRGPDGNWLPVEQARAKYQEIKPQLAGRLDAKMLDGFDPTPANLEAVQGQVLGMAESLKLRAPKTIGDSLVTADGSKVLYRPNKQHVVSADQTLVETPGVGGGAEAAAQPAAAATSSAGPARPPQGGIYATIGQIANQAGAAPQEVTYLQRLAEVESHGDPGARNGRSTGLFQFHPDTFAGVGGKDIHDVGQQTQAALALSRRDRQGLQQLGIEPSDANAYIMHQQGAAGGRALLTSPPEVNAVSALTPIYGSEAVARKAIVNNGGSPDMSAGDFVSMWRQRWSGAGGGGQAQDEGSHLPGGARVLFKGPPKIDDDVVMTPDAVELLAGKYLNNGSLPPFGAGKTGTRNRTMILNRATELAKGLGLDANDLVAGTAGVKAAGSALNKITATIAANDGFEQTAVKNTELMLSLAPKGGGQTNVPVLNRWLQAGRKQIAGDPDVTAFDNALGAFSEEYAKVMTGSLGSAAATDSARAAAADRLGKYATQGQLQAGADVMRKEMANRTASLREVETGLRNTIHNGGQPGGLGGSPHEEQPKPEAAAPALPGATPQQGAYIASMKGKTRGPAGEQSNPFFPVNERQYNALKPGAWYVHPDGQLKQKGGG